MEIMYTRNTNDLIKSGIPTGVYGDKYDLIKYGIEFEGINYDDEWTVRRFLNGLKFSIDDKILNLFTELEISYSLLKRKIKDLSKGQFKLILLVYSVLNKKDTLILDYYDKGLSYKYKKRIISFLKTKYKGDLIVISNDLIFLNNLCSNLIVFKNEKKVFDDTFEKIYDSNIKIEYPEIIKFVKLSNKNGANLTYTVETRELLKDIYRSIK